MNIGVWIAQAGLAFAFLVHGSAMISAPAKLRDRMGYIFAIPQGLRIFIGIAEAAGAAGLILPGLTRVLPVLTPLAALGLALVMLGAIVFHLRRGEAAHTGLNVILLILSLWVAYARVYVVPLG